MGGSAGAWCLLATRALLVCCSDQGKNVGPANQVASAEPRAWELAGLDSVPDGSDRVPTDRCDLLHEQEVIRGAHWRLLVHCAVEESTVPPRVFGVGTLTRRLPLDFF